MNENRVLTCVFCGMEYPQDTPAWGSQILTDHIKVCEKHPLREAESKIVKLRAALIGLMGSSDKAELEKMELALRLLPVSVPESDRVAGINAIRVLIETTPSEAAMKEME